MSTKICTDCRERLPIEQFHWLKKGLIRRSQCKDCIRVRRQRYYQANQLRLKQVTRHYYQQHRKEVISSQMRYRQLRVERARRYVLDYLSHQSCVDCDNSDIRVLEFDHTRGKKSASIAHMIAHGVSITRLQREIDKCSVRCANCHRIRHSLEGGWRKIGVEDIR